MWTAVPECISISDGDNVLHVLYSKLAFIMLIKDKQSIQKALDEIFAHENMLLLGKGDFEKLFPSLDGVQGVRVAGNDLQEVIAIIQDECSGTSATTMFSCYLGRDLKMSELQLLDEALPHSDRWKRGVVLDDLPYGPITVFTFWKTE